MKKNRAPSVPQERLETIRQRIVSAVEQRPLSAHELSMELRIPEKEVYEHLHHIQKTTHKQGRGLAMAPAECRQCGFVFKKRERLKKPGKCPLCHNTSIQEPLFFLADAGYFKK